MFNQSPTDYQLHLNEDREQLCQLCSGEASGWHVTCTCLGNEWETDRHQEPALPGHRGSSPVNGEGPRDDISGERVLFEITGRTTLESLGDGSERDAPVDVDGDDRNRNIRRNVSRASRYELPPGRRTVVGSSWFIRSVPMESVNAAVRFTFSGRRSGSPSAEAMARRQRRRCRRSSENPDCYRPNPHRENYLGTGLGSTASLL